MVSGEDNVGGILGNSYGGSVLGCTNTGSVRGNSNVGGVCGRIVDNTIGYCSNTGSVSGNIFIGGVCGDAEAESPMIMITECFNTGEVNGIQCAGGVCGLNGCGYVANFYNTGAVTATGERYYAGGVCGLNGNGYVANCYNTGEVTATGVNSCAGGVCGFNSGGIVANCYNTGAVTVTVVNSCASGVCGINLDGFVVNCYNTGAVTATGEGSHVGGLIGGNTGTVENCYFLKGSCETAVSENQGTIGEKVLEKTTKQFNSGEVAYLLSQGCTIGEGEKAQTIEGSAWGQKLGTDGDAYPVFSTHKVYKNELYPGCIHEPGTLGYVYENVKNETAYASFTEVTDDAVAPTCGATGLTEGSHCSVCGKVFVEQQTVPATGMHTYGEKVVAPTYGAEGYTLHTCSVCGDSYKDTYTNKKTVPKAAIGSSYTSTGTTITLNWAKVNGVTGYIVYSYDSANSKWVKAATVEGADTLSATVTDLTPGTVTKFKVNAYVVENGKAYYGATSTFLDAAALGNASISQSYTSTGTSITLNWAKVDGATGYYVYKFDKANSKWVLVKTVPGADTLSATITGLKQGTISKFKVKAYLTKGGKTYYGKTTANLDAAALANAKISSDYTSTGTSFTLNWEKVTGATGYNIYKFSGATGKWTLVKTVEGGDVLSAEVTGFTPGSVIKFRVNASITASGKTYEGGWDNSIYAAAIGNASFNESYTSTKTTADVSWGKVDGATGYRVYKYDSASKKWVLVKEVTGEDTTSATVTGLTSKTTTKLKVNAYLTKGTKTYYGKAGTMLSVKTK